jgi:hypothetical protein
MHSVREMLWRFEFALNERFVDDHPCRDVCQFTPLLGLNLLPYRLEIALHPIDANRDAVNQRKRLRVFGEDRSEHA